MAPPPPHQAPFDHSILPETRSILAASAKRGGWDEAMDCRLDISCVRRPTGRVAVLEFFVASREDNIHVGLSLLGDLRGEVSSEQEILHRLMGRLASSVRHRQ